MYCPKCGSELLEGARFCPECGAAVGGQQATTPPPPPAVVARRPWMIGAVLLGVVAAILAVSIPLVLLFAGDGDGDGGGEPTPVTEEPFETPTASPPTPIREDARVIQEIYRILQEDYVDPEAVTSDLLQAETISEMLQVFGDPHTVYIDPESYELGIDVISGTFQGIGAQVEQDPVTGAIVIVTPFRDSPAENAGVRAGDIVRTVDGESTEGWTVAQAVERIRGPEGTDVVLGIEHSGGSTEDVAITRGTIVIPTVLILPIWDAEGNEVNDLAYIGLQQFTDLAVTDLGEELERIVEEGYGGVILDLRRNPGGGLDATIRTADMFMDDGVIIIEVSREGEESVTSANLGGPATEIPVVLLVGPGSASGSEVLACALRDNGRATLIGERTFGKGSVNHLRELSNGGALYVTIARNQCPGGDQFEAVGIDPDVKVVPTEADIGANRDVQLFAAINYLRSGGR